MRSDRAARDPDIFCDIRTIPLPDQCADELHAIHVFEHFYQWETPALLAEWKRLLKRGGLLALEMPDIVKCAMNLLSGTEDNFSYWGMYGDPRTKDPYMCHRWGWTAQTLKQALREAGFAEIEPALTLWHKRGAANRDMRMTARKP